MGRLWPHRKCHYSALVFHGLQKSIVAVDRFPSDYTWGHHVAVPALPPWRDYLLSILACTSFQRVAAHPPPSASVSQERMVACWIAACGRRLTVGPRYCRLGSCWWVRLSKVVCRVLR